MKRISKKQKKSLADVLPLSSVLEVVIREELRDFVIQQGMSALTKLLEEERTALCGAPYERGCKPARRAGSAPGQLVMGGRKVRVKRPRVRDDDGELSLASYQQFSEDDPLAHRALEQMVIGVSTRKYERSLEAVPKQLGPRSTSKSSVSRRFVAATQKQLRSCLGRSERSGHPVRDARWDPPCRPLGRDRRRHRRCRQQARTGLLGGFY